MIDKDRRLEQLRRQPKVRDRASFFFYDNTFRNIAVKVAPAEYFVDTEGLVLTTVLGSCVSVCLIAREGAICGMNHFMLPASGPSGNSARYGLFAMELLINEMLKAGAPRNGLKAKVYGGGAVISGMKTLQIGKQNVDFVESFLKQEGIPVLARDVLDIYPRKITMVGGSGKVIVQKLAKDTSGALAAEASYAKRTIERPRAGEVTLF
ncbi:MAG: chemoreceptor glutamine deamidase CheD [Burkholderiaceae bacterium]